MIDVKLIYKDHQKLKEKISQRGFKVDTDKLIKLAKERHSLTIEINKLRAERNKIAALKDYTRGKIIKDLLKEKEKTFKLIDNEFNKLLLTVPNLALDDVPIGRDSTDNLVIRKWGHLPKFNFQVKSHDEIGSYLGIIDVKRASKVSGARFGYILAEGAILEFALLNYAVKLLQEEGFTLIIPPVLIKSDIKPKLGYMEHGAHENWYFVNDKNSNGFYLVGTAEHAVVPIHKDEVLDHKLLPRRYLAFSSAFRREAGSYGKDTKGIFRVHQFDKLEMVSFTDEESSDGEHNFLLSLQEKLVQGLGLPYQVVKICTGDMAFPTAKQYDIEIWFPSEGRYRETHSTSNTTDFQSRRLNIKYRRGQNLNYVHILNGTAFAIGRIILAILENYQQKDGSVIVPERLREYTGFSKIKPKG